MARYNFVCDFLLSTISFDLPPPLLIFEINSNNITLSKKIGFEECGMKVFQLKGMIYHGGTPLLQNIDSSYQLI